LCRGVGRSTPCIEYRQVGGTLRPPRCTGSDVELGERRPVKKRRHETARNEAQPAGPA
jgi:hypothetical protein